jgi:predicted nucleic acid-binding protein
VFYVDTSALLKLIVAEGESEAMRHWMDTATGRVLGNDLLRTELLRAVRRSVPAREAMAHAILESVLLIRLRRATFEAAATTEPRDLRSLDALHLASALEFRGDLEGIVTYDERLAEAAEANGITVISPR